MGNVTKFEDLDIPALTEVAKESFEEALWATEKALAKQLEFGRVMLIVKSKLPYGEWGNWVRETFQDHLSLRTIQTHMKAHDAVAQNPALLECANSLDDILTLTAKPRKPSVEVIEVAAEIVAADMPAVEVVPVATVKPPATVKPVAAKAKASTPPPEIIDFEGRWRKLRKEDQDRFLIGLLFTLGRSEPERLYAVLSTAGMTVRDEEEKPSQLGS